MNVNRMMKNQKGFSLIELIIVLLIIAIIAVIAIPNMIATRRSANEGSAISTMRALHGAQLAYKTTKGAGNYAGTESENGDTAGLAELHEQGLIDAALGGGVKSGYRFVGSVTGSTSANGASFFFSGNPLSSTGAMKTGTRRYCITQQGVIGADPTNLGVEFTQLTAPTAAPFNSY